jgi:DNA-binding response OmpR family regulator
MKDLSMSILVVEDEAPIREAICAFLQKNNFNTIESVDGQDALNKFETTKLDLILLDINIPQINGISLCRKIRETSNVPIIMITARTGDVDEVIGLESGADDYIKKPFSMIVLLARIKKLLTHEATKSITLGELVINPIKMELTKAGKIINLTSTQFNILYELASHPGVLYTRESLINKIYQDGSDHLIFDRTIDAHVKNIRKYIEDDPTDPKYISTIIGKGYKFAS